MTRYEETFYRNVERMAKDVNSIAKELKKSNYINEINMKIDLYKTAGLITREQLMSLVKDFEDKFREN